MSYDFFVFPAAGADDLAAAIHVYESTPERGALTPGSPVAEFVAAVNEASPVGSTDGFLAEVADGHDAGAEICTTWSDPMANLRTVAGLARPHELSVLDVQLAALYDPRGSLDVSLDTEGGPRLPYLTRSTLTTVLSHITELRYHWVNLTRAPGVYVQAFRDEDGSWAVEHREGSASKHFVARTPDPALVERLLWAWARGDGAWQAMLQFAPVAI
jgi:hypothetical protein